MKASINHTRYLFMLTLDAQKTQHCRHGLMSYSTCIKRSLWLTCGTTVIFPTELQSPSLVSYYMTDAKKIQSEPLKPISDTEPVIITI